MRRSFGRSSLRVLVASLATVTSAGVFATTSAAARWSDFGAPVATWTAAHALDARGCPSGPCYGPRVHSVAQPFEFTHVTTARGRVDGYDQALPNGTPQARAALRALTLLPVDTQMGGITIHHDRFGQSCAYVNFTSATLAKWFGAKGLGGKGTIGVELASIAGQGHVTYNPANVNLLLVVPVYLGSDGNC